MRTTAAPLIAPVTFMKGAFTIIFIPGAMRLFIVTVPGQFIMSCESIVPAGTVILPVIFTFTTPLSSTFIM